MFIKLTKREQLLSKASEDGKNECESHSKFNYNYSEDKHIQEAYTQGWRIAQKEMEIWYKLGYPY